MWKMAQNNTRFLYYSTKMAHIAPLVKTPFQLYVEDMKPDLKERFPQKTHLDIQRILGRHYHSLRPNERLPYRITHLILRAEKIKLIDQKVPTLKEVCATNILHSVKCSVTRIHALPLPKIVKESLTKTATAESRPEDEQNWLPDLRQLDLSTVGNPPVQGGNQG